MNLLNAFAEIERAANDAAIKIDGIASSILDLDKTIGGISQDMTNFVSDLGNKKTAWDNVSSAIKTFGEVVKTVESVGKILDTLTDPKKFNDFIGGIGKAKGGLATFGKALLALPIGLKIVAVAGLVAGLTTLVAWLRRSNSAAEDFRRESQSSAEVIENLINTINRSANAHRERVNRMENDIAATRNLFAQIKELTGVENKSEEQRRRLVNLTAQMTQIMPELLNYLDEETGLLDKSHEALQRQIEARETQMRIQIATERQTELLRQQMETERERAIVLADLRIAEKDLALVHKNNQQTQYATVHILNTVYYDAVDRLRGKYDELTEVIEANAMEMNDWGEIAISSMMEAEEAHRNFTNSYEYEIEKQKIATQMMEEVRSKALQSLATEYLSVKDAATNMFRAMSNESEHSIGELAGNLEGNIAVTRQWGTDIAKLSGEAGSHLYQGFIDYITSLGEDSAGEVRMFAEALERDPEGLQRLSDLFEEAGEASIQALATAYGLDESVVRGAAELVQNTEDTLRRELESAGFIEIGAQVVSDFVGGVDDSVKYAEEVITKMADSIAGIQTESAIDTMVEKVQIYENGLNEVTNLVLTSLTNLDRKAMDILKTMLSRMDTLLRTDGFTAGRNFFRALGDGLIAEQGNLLAQALGVANSIVSIFNAQQQAAVWASAGSFATGLNFVPYDDFPAFLHKGEMVLTAAEAAEYRVGDSSNDIPPIIQNFYGVKEERTAFQVYRYTQKAYAEMAI
ncbi:MAG: hypothetical protein FWD03_03085 [Defluviitaleaceae bacterium]|nr:hypothetical protein [Defluviitaleaceae bacterium]